MKKRIVNGKEEHKHDEFGWHSVDRVHYRSSKRGEISKWIFSRYKKHIIPNDEKCKKDFQERMLKKKVKKCAQGNN